MVESFTHIKIVEYAQLCCDVSVVQSTCHVCKWLCCFVGCVGCFVPLWTDTTSDVFSVVIVASVVVGVVVVVVVVGAVLLLLLLLLLRRLLLMLLLAAVVAIITAVVVVEGSRSCCSCGVVVIALCFAPTDCAVVVKRKSAAFEIGFRRRGRERERYSRGDIE